MKKLEKLINPSIAELQDVFSVLGKEGHKLIIDEMNLTAILNRITKRSKLGYKKVFAFRFKSIEMLKEHNTKYYNDIIQSFIDEDLAKIEKKNKADSAIKSIGVNDIFHYSWGYDQTQCDLFQVIEKPSKSTIIIRPIHSETVEAQSWGSESCRAAINSFIGTKTEKVRLSGDSFKRSCGRAYKVANPNTATFYRSWYA